MERRERQMIERTKFGRDLEFKSTMKIVSNIGMPGMIGMTRLQSDFILCA